MANGAIPDKAAMGQNLVQKKAVKSKRKEIIEISPDSTEVAENDMSIKDEKSSKEIIC